MAQANPSLGLWQRLFGRSPRPATAAHTAPATPLKQQRAANRELLFGVVRENMIRAGVLSSTYKFKVLTLDPAGQQFIVMIDWQEGASRIDGATHTDLEKGLQQLSQERLGLTVKAVYWRHAGAAIAPQAATPAAAPAHACAQAPAAPARVSDPDAVSEDELAAFRAALRASPGADRSAAGRATPSSARGKPADFQPTVITEDAPSTDFGSLSETQYGPLR